MNAPGKSFRKGIALMELFQMFPDDASAERWFEEIRRGKAGEPSHCPHCGCDDKSSVVPSGRPLTYWCGSCRGNFSVRVGTVTHRSRIPLRKWAIAIHLWTTNPKGVSSMKLHRDLGMTQKSAWFTVQCLREAWLAPVSGMECPVEADETHCGGRRKNVPKSMRHQDYIPFRMTSSESTRETG